MRLDHLLSGADRFVRRFFVRTLYISCQVCYFLSIYSNIIKDQRADAI